MPPPTPGLTAHELAAFAADSLVHLRTAAPLVQCITNQVAATWTANVLLALGAAAAMVDIPGEAAVFAQLAQGLLINLGTPVPSKAEAVLQAVEAARATGTSWVLDPVAIGRLPVRTALAAQLLALRPPIVRGNASEILALAGAHAGGRGTDATDTVEHAQAAAQHLATRTGGVVAVSGPVDYLTDGHQHLHLGNGTALLTRITGGGCALGAVMAAFAALAHPSSAHAFAHPTPLLALTAAATLTYTVAAERAAQSAAAATAATHAGPGSFAVHLLDHLAWLDGPTLRERARIQIAA